MIDSLSSVFDALLEALRSAPGFLNEDIFYVGLFNKMTLEIEFPLVARKEGDVLIEVTDKERFKPRPFQPQRFLPDHVLYDRESLPVKFLIDKDFPDWLNQNSLEYPGVPTPLCWLGVPLVARGEIFGVLVVENELQPEVYDEQSEGFLIRVASRIAGQIATARLVTNLRVLNDVGRELTSAGRRLTEQQVVDLIHNQTQRFLNTDSMYIALYDEEQQLLRFPLAVENGQRENLEPRSVKLEDPTSGGLTEVVIRTKQPLCPSDVAAEYAARNLKVRIPPLPNSWLGVPMLLEKKVVGVISLRNESFTRLYGTDDMDVLQAMAGQAAIAIDNARLFSYANERLQVLIDIGHILSSSVRLPLSEILTLIRDQVHRLMNTNNMYVAIYNEGSRELSFPLAFRDGKPQEWPSRLVDIADNRAGGLTEIVIRTKKSLRPLDVEEEYRSRNLSVPVPPVPRSWLGVPLLLEKRIVGVIALQDDTTERLYRVEDEHILETIAGYIAPAIEYAKTLQDSAVAQEILTRESIAEDFVHRARNLTGTIPIWTDLAWQVMQSARDQVRSYLDEIESDVANLIKATEKLQQPLESENIDVAFMLGAILRQVRLQYGKAINVDSLVDPELYQVHAIPSRIANAFWHIIWNAIEAMPDGGRLSIRATNQRLDEDRCMIRVEISDVGVGIAKENLERIFEFGFSTKGGKRGSGLWSARNAIDRAGGSITVESQEQVGTRFTVLLPASNDDSRRQDDVAINDKTSPDRG